MNVKASNSRSAQNYRKIAREILQLASRENQPEGSPLRVAQMAELLNISRTPVNAALKRLAETGIVEHRKNSGFFLRVAAREAEQRFDTDESTAKLHLAFAKDALSWGDGHAINVSSLSRLYGISRYAAEQLMELAQSQGWLERSAGHNWIVHLGITTEEDYARLYRFRRTIEPAALREPAYAPNYAELDRLANVQIRLAKDDYENLSAVDMFEINRELHETIVGWSGNRFYLQALRRSNDLRRLMEYSKVMRTQKIDVFAKEHLDILDAINRDEFERAAELVTQHLEGAMQVKT